MNADKKKRRNFSGCGFGLHFFDTYPVAVMSEYDVVAAGGQFLVLPYPAAQ